MIFSKSSAREELSHWMMDLLPQSNDYLAQSGGSYPENIRYLESLLRPLWGLVPAYSNNFSGLLQVKEFQELLKMIHERTLPNITTENRQIAVELGVIGYAVGTFGTEFLDLLSEEEQTYFVQWLNQINQIEFPAGNWYFFLVLVNAALKKVGLTYSEQRLAFALDGIEGFYLGNGWYSDGKNQQRDYYISFAFHFYGLLYSRFGETATAQKFQQRAITFSNDFLYWFDSAGRSIPYGRSLTYRFAHVSFWAAMVVTDTWKETNLSLGEIKGLILRNLRFWKNQPITAPKEHNLTIGYGYSNLLMSEDYNAPGSPMWAFKAFIVLELSEDAAFWQSTEEDMPNRQKISVQDHAGFHIQASSNEIVALSSRQFGTNELLYHSREKYSKFAYSSSFGFNITRDVQELDNFAIDSTLAFSIPGTNQWQTRGVIEKTKMYETYGVSCWQLWGQIKIITYLIPLEDNGHIRIHQINNQLPVIAVEGGFPLHDWNRKYQTPVVTRDTVLLTNHEGYSRIQDLFGNREGAVVTQGPNSNIYSSEKNAIPVLKTNILPEGEHVFATYVSGSLSEALEEKNYSISESADHYKIQQNDSIERVKITKERF